jgi:hypothetical protein
VLRFVQDTREDLNHMLIRLRIFDSDAHSTILKERTQGGEITKK